MPDLSKPNHFTDDALGDPHVCTGDHNHPERTAEEEAFVEQLKKAEKARDEVIEKAVALFVELAVDIIRLDPHQDGRVPADYKPDFSCQTVRYDLSEVYIHVTEEVYNKALQEEWFNQ